MVSIAFKVDREDGTKLDPKPIVTYETICSTFLPELVNDGEDNSISVGGYFANTAASISSMYSTDSQHDIGCEYSLSSTDTISTNSSACSLSVGSTNSDFSSGSHTSSLLSQSQIASTRSDCSSLQSVVFDRDQCLHMSVCSRTSNQSDYLSFSVTSNQSDYSSSDSSRHMKDDSLDMDHDSYASASDGTRTICDSVYSISSDSAFTSNEDKQHPRVSTCSLSVDSSNSDFSSGSHTSSLLSQSQISSS